MLVLLPPGRYAFYPACPFKTWLGIQCPGCGLTRAASALLQGRFHDAGHYNAMVWLLAPAAVVFALIQTGSALLLSRWQRIPHSQLWLTALSSAMLLFGLFRNLTTLR